MVEKVREADAHSPKRYSRRSQHQQVRRKMDRSIDR